MLFYGVTMIILYLVTATKRTAEARLPLFVVLTVNLILERSVDGWLVIPRLDLVASLILARLPYVSHSGHQK